MLAEPLDGPSFRLISKKFEGLPVQIGSCAPRHIGHIEVSMPKTLEVAQHLTNEELLEGHRRQILVRGSHSLTPVVIPATAGLRLALEDAAIVVAARDRDDVKIEHRCAVIE